MLIEEIMTRNVMTVPSDTPVGEAQKIMKEHNLRRLPVVDRGKLVGLVTLDRLERVKPQTSAPVLWQITYLISHTTVADVMRKDLVTVKPTDTVEHALARAQGAKVGTLIVLDRRKIVGICTTNDFFYRIVNPTLGLGVPGIRILVSGEDIGRTAEQILSCTNRLGIEIKVLWAVTSNNPKGRVPRAMPVGECVFAHRASSEARARSSATGCARGYLRKTERKTSSFTWRRRTPAKSLRSWRRWAAAPASSPDSRQRGDPPAWLSGRAAVS